MPVSEGPEANSVKNESNGIGIDRCNDIFLRKIDDSDLLGIIMGNSTYSAKRVKVGSEIKLSDNAGVKSHEENLKPRKLNFDENKNNGVLHIKMGNSDSDVKSRDGFRNENELLEHSLMLCNGDLDVLVSSNSKLTWFEEQFLFYEFGWGRTLPRQIDISSEATCNVCVPMARKPFDKTLMKACNCRKSWPAFASHEEDAKCRNEKWNEKFAGKCVKIWDNMNVDFNCKHTAS